MADEDLSQRIRAAGFDFARRLRNADFRGLLKANGWQSGQHIVIALDEERVVDVVSRMLMHEVGDTAYIAIPDNGEIHGFEILIVKLRRGPALDDDSKIQAIQLGPGANLGMLCAALQPCGTYLPHAWTQELLFEKVHA